MLGLLRRGLEVVALSAGGGDGSYSLAVIRLQWVGTSVRAGANTGDVRALVWLVVCGDGVAVPLILVGAGGVWGWSVARTTAAPLA